jgi:hypothetical protein
VADRWAIRIARWIRAAAPHGHVVAIHNGPREPAFARRFAADPEAIDTIMFQEWGTRGEADGWLAAGIEEQIDRSLAGWWGTAVFAEYGYERNPELPLLIPSHEHCGPEHTRRGAWRGAFRGLGVIHGFENSWGPFELLGRDQAGLLHLRRFFTEVVPFERLRPAAELLEGSEYALGHRPSALATPDRSIVAAYLPVGGAVELRLPGSGGRYDARWYDPRTGGLSTASPNAEGESLGFAATEAGGGHPEDWVLVLRSKS